MRPHAQAAPLHRACGWCGWCRCGRCRGCRWRGHSAPPLARWIRTGTPGVGSPGRAGGWRAGGVAHQLTPCRIGHACWPAARGTTAPGSVPTGSPAKQQAGWASIGLCPAFGMQTGLFAASATGARVGAELPHRGDTPGVPTGGGRRAGRWAPPRFVLHTFLPSDHPGANSLNARLTGAELPPWARVGGGTYWGGRRVGAAPGQPIRSLEAVGGASRGTVWRVCSVVGTWCVPGRSLGTASHALRQCHCTGLAGGAAGVGVVGVGVAGGVATAPRCWCS
jgi:hypothetical protein